MKSILQSQAAECSLACLAMISCHHKRSVDLVELRRRFTVSLKGSTLPQLMANAASMGFSCRPLRLEMDELSKLQLPCILHWNLNHFVVLAGIKRGRLIVLDPAVGERRLTLEDAARSFTGVAVEVTPSAEFTPAASASRLSLSQLTGSVRGLGRSLLQILLVAAVLELFAIVSPLFNQMVVDDVIASGDRELLTVLVVGFALLLLVQAAVGLVRSWMVMVLGQTLNLQWTANAFAHLIRLPIDFFERRHLGDIVSRFGAVGAIQRTLTTAAIESVIDGMMAMAALGMMLLYAPSLAAVSIAAVLMYGLLRTAAYKPFRDAAAERLVLAAKENTTFLETIRAITPLKLFGREQERRARWQNQIVDVQNRDVRTAKLSIIFSTANTLVFGLEGLLNAQTALATAKRQRLQALTDWRAARLQLAGRLGRLALGSLAADDIAPK